MLIFFCKKVTFHKQHKSLLYSRRMNLEIQKHIEYAAGYLELKMFDEALREADVAAAIAPHDSHVLAIKSAILWEQNRLNEAEPFMAQLAEMNPRNTGLWINLAYIRRRTQSVAAATETLQRAFNANPQDALAKAEQDFDSIRALPLFQDLLTTK